MKKSILFLILIILSQQIKANRDSLYIPQYQNQIQYYPATKIFLRRLWLCCRQWLIRLRILLNPQFIGIKYFAQHYKAKENLFTQDLTQDQYFNTIQLWGKIPVTQKLSIYGSIPFQFHEKKTLQGDIKINGIGDASLMGIYEILRSKTNTIS
jgi:hypothetical protein